MKITVTTLDKESEEISVNVERLKEFLCSQGVGEDREDLEIVLQKEITEDGCNPDETCATYISPDTILLATRFEDGNMPFLGMIYHYITDLDGPHDWMQEVLAKTPHEERPSVKAAQAFARKWKHRSFVTKLTLIAKQQ